MTCTDFLKGKGEKKKRYIAYSTFPPIWKVVSSACFRGHFNARFCLPKGHPSARFCQPKGHFSERFCLPLVESVDRPSPASLVRKAFWSSLDETILLDWKSPHIYRSIDAAGADSRHTDKADVIVSRLRRNFTRCKSTEFFSLWVIYPCPTFTMFFLLLWSLFPFSPYEEKSVLHKSKQNS